MCIGEDITHPLSKDIFTNTTTKHVSDTGAYGGALGPRPPVCSRGAKKEEKGNERERKREEKERKEWKKKKKT